MRLPDWKDKDNMIWITKEECYLDFFEKLMEDKDKFFEIACTSNDMVQLIKTKKIVRFPIIKRKKQNE